MMKHFKKRGKLESESESVAKERNVVILREKKPDEIFSSESLFDPKKTRPVQKLSKKMLMEKYVIEGNLQGIKKNLEEMGPDKMKNYIDEKKYGYLGESLLHVAVRFRQRAVINFFRKLGVKLDLFNHDLETPLHYAAMSENNIEIFEELIQFKNALDIFWKEDRYGRTVNFYATRLQRMDVFDLIFQYEKQSDEVDERFYYKFYDEETANLWINIKKKESKDRESRKAKREDVRLKG